MPYIYIIHCRASINCRENVYKIGKTDNICNRMHGYDKGSVAIFSLFVCDSDSFEKHLIALFTEQFIKRHDYGNEYFEGNLSKMISLIMIEFNKVDTYIYDIKHGETIVTKIKKTKPKEKIIIEIPPTWIDIFDADTFICEKCDFKCSKKYNYTTHLSTAKHMKITSDDKMLAKNVHKCICGNEYNHRQNLYRHKKTCIEITNLNYKNKIIEDLMN